MHVYLIGTKKHYRKLGDLVLLVFLWKNGVVGVQLRVRYDNCAIDARKCVC